jgi:HK97 family phage major capsid protein
MTLQELREKHLNAVRLGRDIAEKAEKEKRDLTPEEVTNAGKYLAEADTYAAEVRVREGLERHDAALTASRGTSAAARQATDQATDQDPDGDEPEDFGYIADIEDPKARAKAQATNAWLRLQVHRALGLPGLTLSEAHQRLLFPRQYRASAAAINTSANAEQRAAEQRAALQVGVDVSGGILVPPQFSNQIVSAEKEYGGMLDVAYTFETTDGAPLPIPTDNDVSNQGAFVGEALLRDDLGINVAAIPLGAYMIHSHFVKASIEFLNDAAIDVQAWVSKKFGVRIARRLNVAFTTGKTTGQPQGMIPACVSALTTASATTISYDEYYKLKHSVDPAYRKENPRWMFSDATLLQAKLQKSNQGHYLWQSGVATKSPDTIDGDPYTINQDMPAPTAGQVGTVAYGAMSYYYHRKVAGATMIVLRERYAELGQVAFLAFERHDGALIDAGTHPVKVLTMHS